MALRSQGYKSVLVYTRAVVYASMMPGNLNARAMLAAVTTRKKNPHAVALGKQGGKKGGVNRWKNVSAEERSRILRAAVEARWAKARAKKKPR